MLSRLPIYVITALVLFTGSCKIYSFKGSTLDPSIKTFTVVPFVNQASIVVPSLSNTLTEKLKDKCIRELNLSHSENEGQIIFRGTITSYKTGPASVTSNEVAASTRLTITTKIVFENKINPEQSFDASFSHYVDFDSKKDLASIENDLIEEIAEMMIQDIFNRAINNW